VKSSKSKNISPKTISTKSNESDGLWKFSLLLAIIGFFVFFPNLKFDFLNNWDDDGYILNNPDIKILNFENFKLIFSKYYGANYQPLSVLMYAILHSIVGQQPLYFHLLNNLFHAGNAVLVYIFLIKLTNKNTPSFFIALLFAVHPMHVESVTWISELKDVSYAFFILLALINYVKFKTEKKNLNLILTYLFFILSLFCKSAAVVLPPLLILIDYWYSKRWDWKPMLMKIPFFVLSLIFGIVALLSQKEAGAMDIVLKDYTILEKFLIICTSITTYFYKLIFPHSLSAIYFYPSKIDGVLPWYFYISPLVIGLIVIVIFKFKKIREILFFGIGFFAISISVVLQFVPVGGAYMADRYTYIPYIGLSFALIYPMYQHWGNNRKFIQYFNYSLVGIALIFSILTWNRNDVWKNSLTLFTDIVNKYPKEEFGFYMRGNYYYAAQDYTNAVADYSKAIENKNDIKDIWNNRGLAYLSLKENKKALFDFNQAISMDSTYDIAWYNRGLVKDNLKDYKGAIYDYSKSLSYSKINPSVYLMRGNAYFMIQDYNNAILDFTSTLNIDNQNIGALRNRAIVLNLVGKYEASSTDFDKLLLLNANNAEAYLYQGNNSLKMNNLSQACLQWKKASEMGMKQADPAILQYCK